MYPTPEGVGFIAPPRPSPIFIKLITEATKGKESRLPGASRNEGG